MKKAAVEICNAGIEKFLEGDTEKALDLFLQAAEKDPALAEAWGNTATIYALKKDFVKALENIEKAISLRSASNKFWSAKAEILLKARRLEEAMEAADISVRRSYREDGPFLIKGDIFMAKNDFVRARESYLKALSYRSDNISAIKKLRLCAKNLHLLQEEFFYSRRLTELEPENLEHWLSLALMEENRNHMEKALGIYEKARVKHPENIILWIHTAKIQAFLHRDEEALKSYEKALAMNPQAEDRVNIEKQIELLSESQKRCDGREQFFAFLDRHLGSPQYAETVGALLREGKEKFAGDERYVYARAFHSFTQGETEDSEKNLALLLEKSPDNSDYLVLKGLLLLKSNRLGEAEEFLRRGIEQNPANTGAILNLAQLLASEKRYLEAAGEMEKLALLKEPDTYETDLTAFILYQLQENSTAEKLAESTMQAIPMLADIKFRLGKYEEGDKLAADHTPLFPPEFLRNRMFLRREIGEEEAKTLQEKLLAALAAMDEEDRLPDLLNRLRRAPETGADLHFSMIQTAYSAGLYEKVLELIDEFTPGQNLLLQGISLYMLGKEKGKEILKNLDTAGCPAMADLTEAYLSLYENGYPQAHKLARQNLRRGAFLPETYFVLTRGVSGNRALDACRKLLHFFPFNRLMHARYRELIRENGEKTCGPPPEPQTP